MYWSWLHPTKGWRIDKTSAKCIKVFYSNRTYQARINTQKPDTRHDKYLHAHARRRRQALAQNV